MRILFLTPDLFGRSNGTTARAYGHLKGLLSNGHEVYAVLPGPPKKAVALPGLRIHWMPTVSRLKETPAYIRCVVRLAQQVSFDVCHAVQRNRAKVGLLLRYRYRIPLVADLHAAIELEKPRWRGIYQLESRLLLSRADAVTVPTPELARFYSSIGLNASKLFAVSNSIDLAEFAPRRQRESVRKDLGLDPDTPLLFFHGNLQRVTNQKALNTLATILDMLAEEFPSVTCLVVGHYERIPVANPRFRYLGYQTSYGDFMSAADLAVLPLTAPSLGMRTRIPECLAASLPVVTTPTGLTGLSRLTQSGAAIIANDTGEFVRALTTLLRDQEQLRRHRAAAKLVSSEFSIEKMGADLTVVYRAALRLSTIGAYSAEV